MSYVGSKKARETLGVCAVTLRKWEKEGKIKSVRSPGNHRLYDVSTFVNCRKPDTKKKYIYARVSTNKQKEDLERQIAYLKEDYPDHIVLKEIASGINFKRKVLNRLLEESHKGMVGEVVVSHRDRLCRIAFDHFAWLFELYRVNLVVVGEENFSPESEMCEDLFSIIHVFSCRHYGQRRRIRKEEPPEDSTEDSPKVRKSNPRKTKKERPEGDDCSSE